MPALIIQLANHRPTDLRRPMNPKPGSVVPFRSMRTGVVAERDAATAERDAAKAEVHDAMARVVAAKRRAASPAEVAALTALWRSAKITAALAMARAGRLALRASVA